MATWNDLNHSIVGQLVLKNHLPWALRHPTRMFSIELIQASGANIRVFDFSNAQLLPIEPVFDLDSAVWEEKLALPMLHVVHEHPNVPFSIYSAQGPVTMTSVSFPHSNVPFSRLQEGGSFSMALSFVPFSLIEISIVEVASAGAVAQVVQPFALVLIVPWVLPVFSNEATIAFAKTNPE